MHGILTAVMMLTSSEWVDDLRLHAQAQHFIANGNDEMLKVFHVDLQKVWTDHMKENITHNLLWVQGRIASEKLVHQ